MPRSVVLAIVVDPERAARALIESAVRALGWELISRATLPAARRACRGRAAEVIVADSGAGAAAELQLLRRAHPRAALVVSAPAALAADARAAFSADGVIEKPCEDPARIRTVLEHALERVRLGTRNERVVGGLEESKQRLEEAVATLLDLHRANAWQPTGGDAEAVLRQFVAAAARALGAERVTLQLLDPATGELVLRAGIGIAPGLRGTRKCSADGIAGRILRDGSAVLVHDLANEPELSALALKAPEYRSQSFVSAPIRMRTTHARGAAGGGRGRRRRDDRVVGCIHASNKRAGAFETADLERLSALAEELAAAIESERRLADLVEANDRLAVAYAGVERARKEACLRRRELEGELEAKRRELELALLRLDEEGRTERRLLDNVRHELDPISAILGLVEVIGGNGGDDAIGRADLARAIRAEARGFDRLVDELLRLARPAPPVPDLHDVEAEVSRALARVPAEGRCRLRPHLAHGLVAYLDPESFHHATLALIDNALRFSPPASPIDVALAAREADGKRSAALAVTDRGPGIPASERARVQQPFAQLEQPATGKPSGFGLGLAIARRAVLPQGGRLVLGEAAGRGAAVELWLPLAAGA